MNVLGVLVNSAFYSLWDGKIAYCTLFRLNNNNDIIIIRKFITRIKS